jgi:hypothetical protein
MPWEEISYLLVSLFMAFMLYGVIKTRKDDFSSENLFKSMYTLGVLALGLIAFIGYCVWMLNSSQSY